MAKRSAIPVGLGLRAVQGGAVVVGVAVEGDDPRVVLSTFLATSDDGDRLAFEPYKFAAELKRDAQGGASAEAAAAVAEGRRRQDLRAEKSLHAIVQTLKDAGCKPVVAALLVNRAGWITDLLEYALSWPEHVPVAEGLAVRDALRFAVRECGVKLAEMDEKSLRDLAAQTFNTSCTLIDARLKSLGATVGRPWRKEQKLSCLSAWFAVRALR